MRNEIRDLIWYVIGFVCGMMVMAAVITQPQQVKSTCQEELATCQQTLNDPHACVSIVVEILEGHYEQTNININEN